MLNDKRIWSSTSLLIPTAGMLALYAYIATFSRLMGDDYCLLYYADRFGPLRSIWYWYLNFHGGFSGVFVDYFLVFFGEKWMGLVLPACLVLWAGIAAYSFAALTGPDYRGLLKNLSAFALGCTLVVAVFVWSPDIQQSYYWWAGTRKYVMPLIAVSLYPGLYINFAQKDWDRWVTLLWYVFSFTLLFFVGGFSETFNPGLFVAFSFILGMRLWLTNFDFKEKQFLFLLFGIAGLGIAFILMILAPGNSIRHEAFPEPPSLWTALQIATLSYVDFLTFIPKSWVLFSVFLGAIIGAINIGMGSLEADPPRWWLIGFNLLAAFVVPWACFVPFAYIAVEPLVPRALINPAFLFTAFLMYTALLSGKWISSRTQIGKRMPLWGGLAVLTLVLLSVSLWQAGKEFYSLSQAHRKYAKEWDRVQVEILHAVEEGRESLSVPPRENWAGVLELRDNPRFYVNQCISKYYNLNIKTDDSLRVSE